MERRLDEFISLPPLLVSMLSDNFVPNSGEYDALRVQRQINWPGS